MNIRQFAFGLGAALILVGPAVSYFFTRNTSVAALSLIVAVTFVLVCKLDVITEVSFGPLRARMKETIAEATATLNQLRGVATTTTQVLLTDLMAGSMMDGMSQRKRFELHDAALTALKDLGASASQLMQVESEWRKGVNLIYHRGIYTALLQAPGGRDLAAEFQHTMRFDEWWVMTPTEMRKFFARKNVPITPTVERILVEYARYRETGDITNLDEFLTY